MFGHGICVSWEYHQRRWRIRSRFRLGRHGRVSSTAGPPNEFKLHTWSTRLFTILFVSWNNSQQRQAELQRRLEEMRKVALSRNQMRHQMLHQALLQPHAARGLILGSWISKSLVQARLTTISTHSQNPETRSLTCMQGNTVYLTICLGNLLSVFTVSTTRRSLNVSSDP